jgi:nucleotide-binding universal stress UspA family protein
MKVLVAIDGTEFSYVALKSVTQRDWPENTEFMLLAVVEPTYDESGSLLAQEERKHHQNLVDKTIAELRRKVPGHLVTGLVTEGGAREQIIDVAKNWDADFIVLGSHGRAPGQRYMLGSVAEGVVAQAPCSVEVIRNKQMEESYKTKSVLAEYSI